MVRFSTTAAAETAFIAGELYRRGGQWKFRAVGQGYANGLAGLAADFGISVDDPGTSAPAVGQARSLIKGAENCHLPCGSG